MNIGGVAKDAGFKVIERWRGNKVLKFLEGCLEIEYTGWDAIYEICSGFNSFSLVFPKNIHVK